MKLYHFYSYLRSRSQLAACSGRGALLLAAFMLSFGALSAQVTVEFATAGAGSWVVPAGVSEVVVEAWGGGGSGAASTSAGGKAGGGGGAYARSKLVVAPGDVISYQVGGGSTTSAPGDDSWFSSGAVLLAKGGASGAGNFGGVGGNAAECIGNEVVFSGGSGANRGTSDDPYRDGGGGGSAAGTAANGSAGVGFVGGVAPAGGGNGGDGKSMNDNMYVDAAGKPGGLPGGGGGGGYSATFASIEGGRGGDGKIRVTYTLAAAPEIELLSSLPASFCPGAAHSPTLNFNSSGFSGAQTFTVELSNASGSFASPVVIGTGATSPIVAAIPGGILTAGGNYKLRVVRYESSANVVSNELAIGVVAGPSVTVPSSVSLCQGAASATLNFGGAVGAPDQYSIVWSSAATGAGFANVSNATLPAGSIQIPIPSGAVANTNYGGTLTVRNSSTGCVSTGNSISVMINEAPVITSVKDLTLCFGSVSQIALPYTSTGSAGNFSIKWGAKANAAGFSDIVKDMLWGSPLGVAIPQNAPPDVYTGTMIIENSVTGCVSKGYEFKITIHSLPSITLGTNPTVCAGVTSTVLPYTATVGAPDQYSIAWETPAGMAGFTGAANMPFPSGGTLPVSVPANVPPGTYDGRVYIKNTTTSCQGNGYSTFRVQVLARPTITPGANPVVCAGAVSASLPYTNASGNPGQYSITWNSAAVSNGFANVNNAALPSSAISIVIPGGVAANTYAGKLTVRNTTTGCVSDEYTISVTVASNPTITLGAAPSICAGVTSAAQSYTATGNANQYSVVWGTTAITAGFANVTNAALPAGTITITVPAGAAPAVYNGTLNVRNSAIGCISSTQNISVTVLPRPVASISSKGPIDLCAGGDTLLTAGSGSGYSYQWKGSTGVVGSGVSYTADATGSYYVVITDGNNCRDSSAAVDVTVYPSPIIDITPGDTAYCSGEIVRFEAVSADTGLSYRWKNGGALLPETTAFLNVATSGNYYVVAERNAIPGCADSSNTIEVTVHPLPQVSITRDGNRLYTDDDFHSYQWLIDGQPVTGTDAKAAIFEPIADGNYSVQVTDSNGCINTSTEERMQLGITRLSRSSVLMYPNPTADVLNIEAEDFLEVILYNMEGKLVGRFQGASIKIGVAHLPDGLYVAMIADKHGFPIGRETFVKRTR